MAHGGPQHVIFCHLNPLWTPITPKCPELYGIPMETAVTSLKAAVVGDGEALALIEKRCIVCCVDNLAADKLRCRSLQR